MNLNLILKKGFSDIKFGLTTKAVESILGKPNLTFNDDDDNIIWLYNELKLRLTFYADEDFRMGYIICSHLNVKIFEDNILEKPIEEVINNMKKKGLSTWETEQFDSTFNYFNEDNWLVLQSEFGLVNKVELGVVQKNLDEFNW